MNRRQVSLKRACPPRDARRILEGLERRTLLNAYALGDATTANNYLLGDQRAPVSDQAADDSFVIAWQSEGQDGSGSGIYGRVFSPDGTPKTVAFRVNTYTINDQIDPDLDVASNGTFVIVWESAGQDSSDSGVYLQRFAADGSKVGVETAVNTYTLGVQSDPCIALADDGTATVAWSGASLVIANGIFMKRFSADNTVSILDGLQSAVGTSSNFSPQITVSKAGEVALGWTQVSNGVTSIVGRSLNLLGTLSTTMLSIDQGLLSDKSVYQIEYTVDNKIAFLYGGRATVDDRFSLKIHRYLPDGTPDGPEYAVGGGDGRDHLAGSLNSDALNRHVVAWYSVDPAAATTHYQLHVNYASADGRLLSTTSALPGFTADNARPTIVIGTNYSAFVIYESTDGEDTDIAMVHITNAITRTTGSGNDAFYGVTDGNSLSLTVNGAVSSYLTSDYAAIVIDSGAGNDRVVLRNAPLPAYINAGAGDDYVEGTTFGDVVSAGDGKDLIYGLAGDDVLRGDAGNDRIFADEGNDILEGGADRDYLEGGNGIDRLSGMGSADTLNGGSGSDRLYGGRGDDSLEGKNGNDRLYGGEGNDLLVGGNGDDRVYGELGNDRLFGNMGVDILDGGDGDDSAAGDLTDFLLDIEHSLPI